MKPYTYLIGWSKEKKFYYGVRYSKKCNPNELWVKYFTSSKHVHKFKELYGEPDIIQIRKVFITVDDARNWESKVLKRLNVVNRLDFINMTDNKSISTEAANKGRQNRDLKKLSNSMKQFYKNADKDYIEHIKENRRSGLLNKSSESKLKQSEGIKKYQLQAWSDPIIKEERSKSMRKPKLEQVCPHCGKIGRGGIMKKWHFDNCSHIVGG